MRLGSPASKSRLRMRLAAFDAIWAIVSPVLALALRDPGLLDLRDFPFALSAPFEYALVTTLCAIPAFLIFRISEGMSRFFSARDAFSACVAVAAAIGASSVALFVVTRLDGVPRSTPLICGLVMSAGLLVARAAARIALQHDWTAARRAPEAPDHVRRVVLVGIDRFAAIAIKLIDSQRPRTTSIVAALDSRAAFHGRTIGGVKIVGPVETFVELVEEYAVHGVAIDEVWICDDVPLSVEARHRLQRQCDARTIRLASISQALNLVPAPATAARPARNEEPLSGYARVKRALDIIAVCALVPALFPVATIVALLALIDVGAPIVFWQERVGRGGRRFLLYKFRTLRAPFDANGNRIPEEQRLSRLGRFMRSARLDEIPQLWNVANGDMSIVGPRPLLPQHQPSDPTTRLRVRPGITGWAQINGGTIVTAEEKDSLDAWYVRHASLALDLRIVANTIRFLFTGEKLNAAALAQAKNFQDAALKEKLLRAPAAFTPSVAARVRSAE